MLTPDELPKVIEFEMKVSTAMGELEVLRNRIDDHESLLKQFFDALTPLIALTTRNLRVGG